MSSPVFIYPTDTCYGIGCSVFDEEALKRVYQAKGRNFNKPVNIMVDCLEMSRRFGEISPLTERLIEAFLPGDLTLLVKRATPSGLSTSHLPQGKDENTCFLGPACQSLGEGREAPRRSLPRTEPVLHSFQESGGEGVLGLPSFLNPTQPFIGIRIPNNDFCMELIKTFNAPIVTTSANIAGEPETYSLSDIQKVFGTDNPNIDYVFDGGTLPKNPPSTIVQVEDETWKIIRQGRVTEEMILQCLRERQ